MKETIWLHTKRCQSIKKVFQSKLHFQFQSISKVWGVFLFVCLFNAVLTNLKAREKKSTSHGHISIFPTWGMCLPESLFPVEWRGVEENDRSSGDCAQTTTLSQARDPAPKKDSNPSAYYRCSVGHFLWSFIEERAIWKCQLECICIQVTESQPICRFQVDSVWRW